MGEEGNAGNLSRGHFAGQRWMGNPGWARMGNPGKDGQLWATLCKAGQRKTTKNIPPTFHRPSSSVFRGNYECFPFRVGFIRACEKFLFCPPFTKSPSRL